ncbi:MAG: hypothetical protein IJI33_06825 [Solobacterium sp.]|jgi:hypothetical protein|nr:hypothetical protein [Solobacterium sp.]MBR0213490.1 hypothetical protein [Solobacterium sp.]
MKKLFDSADAWMSSSGWKDLAMLKICVASLGIAVGTALPAKHRKKAAVLSGLVFAATYAPLMINYFEVLKSMPEENAE